MKKKHAFFVVGLLLVICFNVNGQSSASKTNNSNYSKTNKTNKTNQEINNANNTINSAKSTIQNASELSRSIKSVFGDLGLANKKEKGITTILVNGIDFDDPNLASLKENLREVQQVKKVTTDYKNGIAAIEVFIKKDASELWDKVPSGVKTLFKTIETSDNLIVLQYKNSVNTEVKPETQTPSAEKNQPPMMEKKKMMQPENNP